MTRTLFFRMLLRKFLEIANNKPVFSQYNIFYKLNIYFFNLRFDLFSIIAKEVNKIRNNVVYVVARLCCSLCFAVHSIQVAATLFSIFS